MQLLCIDEYRNLDMNSISERGIGNFKNNAIFARSDPIGGHETGEAGDEKEWREETD